MSVLPAYLFWGDSNFASSDGFGWYERALNRTRPYMRLNSAGAGLARIGPSVLGQVEGHKLLVIQMGTNNFSASAATNMALLATAITSFREAGIEKVLACTLPPSTESTEGDWSTTTGQFSTPGTSPNRENLNDAIRATVSSPGGSNPDAVFDGASYVEVAFATNLFTINGKAWAVKTAPGVGTVGTYGTGPHFEDRGMAAAAVGGAIAFERFESGETGFLQQNPNLGT